MSRNDFCIFILTHGRPHNVVTWGTLQRAGYTGPVFVVVDNEDKTADEYKKVFGQDRVLVFDKAAVAATFDEADNFHDRRTVVYARNACFELAEELGYTYFLQLDDDYTSIDYRYDASLEYYPPTALVRRGLDDVLDCLIKGYIEMGVTALALAQGGDFIGGGSSVSNAFVKGVKLRRKCMNTFICSTERPFKFLGRVNEDVNTYTALGSRGVLMLTTNQLSICQVQTQSSAGGMTDIYLAGGTYVKSFYSVMYQPSSVHISAMGNKFMRLHHHVKWKNTVPLIIDQKWRKS